MPEGDTKAALLAQIACLPETPPPPVAEGGAQAGSSGVAVAGAAGGEADKMDEDAPAKEAKTLDEPRTTILPEARPLSLFRFKEHPRARMAPWLRVGVGVRLRKRNQ